MRQRKRTTDAAIRIRGTVEQLFSAANFTDVSFPIPSDRGAQLSMTGEILAHGNGGTLAPDRDTLRGILASLPALWQAKEADLDRYAQGGRYFLLCGDCDRCVAMVGAAAEMVQAGVRKLVIAADTAAERDNLVRSLEWMRAGLGNVTVTYYRPTAYDNVSLFKAASDVYRFLTSDSVEILVLGRDSFNRDDNILRRSEAGEPSLSDLIALAHPVVLTSTQTVDAARSMAKSTERFSPLVTLQFTGEVRRLKDAVIYSPTAAPVPTPEPEQIGM